MTVKPKLVELEQLKGILKELEKGGTVVTPSTDEANRRLQEQNGVLNEEKLQAEMEVFTLRNRVAELSIAEERATLLEVRPMPARFLCQASTTP